LVYDVGCGHVAAGLMANESVGFLGSHANNINMMVNGDKTEFLHLSQHRMCQNDAGRGVRDTLDRQKSKIQRPNFKEGSRLKSQEMLWLRRET
jgi:hypothetical protein